MKNRVYCADFETTVYNEQTYTEVWAASIVECFSDDEPIVWNNISDFMEYIDTRKENSIVYFHNLKFDGNFIMYYLKRHAETWKENSFDTQKGKVFYKANNDDIHSYQYLISASGQWYSITLVNRYFHRIEIRDSLKLLPLSVRNIGKSFRTKHQKLEIEYTGFRKEYGEISEQEEQYIKNDVFVMKEAMEQVLSEGHNRLTIGSCCLNEYKDILSREEKTTEYFFNLTTKQKIFRAWFPDMDKTIEANVYGSETIDKYIRKAYKGGWCYVAPEKQGKIIKNGVTADVNSLYPYVMHSKSGNIYPYGMPTFWKGNYIPEEALKENRYYFVRFKTRFYLKDGFLPFIQMKQNLHYRPTEYLTSSDIITKDGKRYTHRETENGIEPITVTLTLTKPDYNLFIKHYYVSDFEILDGCYFEAISGLFDTYIDKYKKIKMNEKGGKRTIAKLYSNNLYGKFATSNDSSYKYADLNPKEGFVRYHIVSEHKKDTIYIPVGAAVTSYARCYTIGLAQKNYHGDKPGFCYADTDSLHLDLPLEEIKDITVHPTEYGAFKLETYWDTAYFARQKTYIEHVTHEDGNPVRKYYNIKACGMPEKCKTLLSRSIEGISPAKKEHDKFTAEERQFIRKKREITDLKEGLVVPGKLVQKVIPGGVVLYETTFEYR